MNCDIVMMPLCFAYMLLFIVDNVAKPLSLETNCFCIKNRDIQMKDLMLANGVAKYSCWLINWLNTDEEYIRVKNRLNVTCATNGLLIQGT